MPCYRETSTETSGGDVVDGPATAEKSCGKCTHMCKMCKCKTGLMSYSSLVIEQRSCPAVTRTKPRVVLSFKHLVLNSKH